MKATVIDLPSAIPHARELAAREGITDLVEHREGDVTRDDLGTGWDVVLLSNILHHFQPPKIAEILARRCTGRRPTREQSPSGRLNGRGVTRSRTRATLSRSFPADIDGSGVQR